MQLSTQYDYLIGKLAVLDFQQQIFRLLNYHNFTLSMGVVNLCLFKPSQANLVLSEIHSSFTSSFILGIILRTSPVLWVTTMLLPTLSKTSMDSVFLVSQGRAMNAQGLEVRAPTGQRSITFPESSDINIFSTQVPICIWFPRPVVPRSSTPATSDENLTHLVKFNW